METIVYLVRHAQADFSLENYHGRHLSEKGRQDAKLVAEILKNFSIDYFISSSSPRAIETIQPLAEFFGKEIEQYDELRELLLRGKDVELEPDQVDSEIKKVFEMPDYKLKGGESRKEVEARGVVKFNEILEKNRGKTLVLGTHGIIMTLIL